MVDLSKALHIDTKPESFLGHKSSALPIIPFTGSELDVELPRLTNYLTRLSRDLEFQDTNKNTFRLDEISQVDSVKVAISIFSTNHK